MGIPIILCALGYILPNFILNRMISSRHKKIRESLPDALDLLVVCVEAGQGLDAAIKRVSDDLQESSPTISQELILVNLETMAGLDRQQALKNLGERTGVEELVFPVQCPHPERTLRDQYRSGPQNPIRLFTHCPASETGGPGCQDPVKLVFPMLLFIFRQSW